MSVGDVGRGVRTISLERGDFVALLREAGEVNAGVWIRVNGNSMAPAIPPGSDVHVVPVAASQVRRGNVVLALRDSGSPVLHRVVRVANGRVQLKGDHYARSDAPLGVSAIVAIADRVVIGGVDTKLADRPVSLSLRLRQLHGRVRAAVMGLSTVLRGTNR